MKDVRINNVIVGVCILLVFGLAYIIYYIKDNSITQQMSTTCDVGMCEDVKCAMNVVCNINKDSRACDLAQLRYVTCMSKPKKETVSGKVK